jgi:hypothetical protein
MTRIYTRARARYKKWQILSFDFKGKEFCQILLLGFKERLVGQSLAALIATTLQNLSASGRCHSLTEAMYFALLSFFGLECSFHDTFSCIWFFLFFVFGGYRVVFRG